MAHTYRRCRTVWADNRSINYGSTSIFMLLHPRDRVVSGSSRINICCTEFCFRYTVRNYVIEYASPNIYWVQMMPNEDRETARPVSASSYSEICPLYGLSASIVWEATWLWLAKEFEQAGLSSASFERLKLCLPPWNHFYLQHQIKESENVVVQN